MPAAPVDFDALAARRDLLDLTLDSVREADPASRASLIREARFLINELGGAPALQPPEVIESSGLVNFHERLEQRRAGAKGKGRSRKAR